MQPIKALYIEIERFLLQVKKEKTLNFNHSHSLVSYSLSIALKKTIKTHLRQLIQLIKLIFLLNCSIKLILVPIVFSGVARLTFKNE